MGTDWVGWAGSIASIVSVIGVVVAYLVRISLKMDHKIDQISAEQHPTSPDTPDVSMRDTIDKIYEQLERLNRDLGFLAGAFEEHKKEQ